MFFDSHANMSSPPLPCLQWCTGIADFQSTRCARVMAESLSAALVRAGKQARCALFFSAKTQNGLLKRRFGMFLGLFKQGLG